MERCYHINSVRLARWEKLLPTYAWFRCLDCKTRFGVPR